MPTFLRHHADFHLRSQALATSLSSYDIIVVHCGTHADLWLTATCPLLWDLAASFDKAVRDQNLSLFLRHHHRLVAASSPAFICAQKALATSLSSVSCCFFESSVRPLQGLSCGIMPTFICAQQALETSLSSVSCCFLESNVRPLQGLSCGIMPTFICAHRRL
jgi:hypothetical protein